MKNEIEKLRAEEEQAGLERDYERAAQKKAERLRLEGEFNSRATNGKPNINWMKW
jgi:ATP-dependent Clp protease ATP-binding subunit ClpC